MVNAPRTIGGASLRYTPRCLEGASATREWRPLGEYWLDAANTDFNRVLKLVPV